MTHTLSGDLAVQEAQVAGEVWRSYGTRGRGEAHRPAPFLADDAVIVLDDVARPDEWVVAERWLRDDPRLTLQRIAHEKGTAILSRGR